MEEEKERRGKARLDFKSYEATKGQATKEQTRTRFCNLTLINLSLLERQIREGDKLIYMLSM